MLPTINGKSFMDCSLKDFNEILDNESYRENDQVDYKKSFAVFEIPKENRDGINKEKAEFRKDVCAMANAQGGYLVYGIKEDGKGIPHEIVGVAIKDNNSDRFENDIRNILQSISPKAPHCELRFIPYESNYIIVIYVHSDYNAPYIFLENNQDYRIYKRAGNAAIVASYAEMRSMFTQSLSMEKEIQNYRLDRVLFFRQQEDTPEHKYSQFMLLHIIPDTFLDPSYNKSLFLLRQKNQIYIDDVFNSLYCIKGVAPFVDGVRYISYNNADEGRLFNNGVAEAFVPLYNLINCLDRYPKGRLASISLWGTIESTMQHYIRRMGPIINTSRLFICISVIGCKDIVTDDEFSPNHRGTIDRDTLICNPVSIEDYTNDEMREMTIKRLHVEFMFSLGIRYQRELKTLIDEIQI